MFQWNDRELLRYLGHKGQELTPQIENLILECKLELEQIAVPKSHWNIFPLMVKDKQIDMTCLQTTSKHLSVNLRDCKEVILFGATLGSGVDLCLRRYSMTQVSKSVVMQAASVAMLETYCDEVNDKIKEIYLQNGKFLRPRFSPGYGDFPIECQKKLIGALELPKKIGLTVTDHYVMVPSKSVTAIMGVSYVPQTCKTQGCEVCKKIDCLYRR